MNEAYKKQVALLLDVLPETAKEECFAMHGGTAINLFVRDMPRLSVDIDLTYVEIADRKETLNAINAALVRIKERIGHLRPSIRIQHKENVCKLLLDEHGVLIKIEVNVVGRGLLDKPKMTQLCEAAQEQFNAFCAVPIVSLHQLYGSKLCAALDRQHSRDLFDVKLLLDNEGFTKEIKVGFLLGLVSSNRPTHEMLDPHLIDHRIAFENQFEGMTKIEFSYADYESTRLQLIETVKSNLNDKDKSFLISLNRLEPDWSIHNFQHFPAVKWKLLNLERFKKNNSATFTQHLTDLEVIFEQ